MTIRKPLWATLGVLIIVAGCDSPRQAEGTGRSNSRRSQANRAAPQRPPTPAEEMAKMSGGTDWTNIEISELKRMVAENMLKWSQIGNVLGRSERACRKHASKLGIHKSKPKYREFLPPPRSTMDLRICLKCHQSFTPPDKNFFVCTPCKSTKSWREGQWMRGVL